MFLISFLTNKCDYYDNVDIDYREIMFSAQGKALLFAKTTTKWLMDFHVECVERLAKLTWLLWKQED